MTAASRDWRTAAVIGKVYVFGGIDPMNNLHNDLWEWNGDKWVECPADSKPLALVDTALAHDPARKSLILFGSTWYGEVAASWGMVNVSAIMHLTIPAPNSEPMTRLRVLLRRLGSPLCSLRFGGLASGHRIALHRLTHDPVKLSGFHAQIVGWR